MLVLFNCCSIKLYAQWDTITTFNQVIQDLQTFDNKLFIAGGFVQNETHTCYWSAYYDGSDIICHTNMIGGMGIRQLAVFNSLLYCVDALDYGGVSGVGVWNGSTWQDGGSTNYSHSTIYADGNDLYVVSDDGKIRKKTGTNSFQPFYDFAGNGDVSSICRYNGNLVFAGTFSAVNSLSVSNIAQWNGATWQPLGTGISTGANCMTVFNNELYVAGRITSAGGNTVTSIAKWNGTSWSSVGGGVTSSCPNGIRDMIVFNGGLYIVGDFTQVGSVNTINVAKWNGSQWTGLGIDHNDEFVNCIEVYNNKIYVGTFDYSHSHIFRYDGPAGVDEINNHIGVSIFPNPATDNIRLEIPLESEVEILNIEGQIIKTIAADENHFSIDISGLTRGMYFVRVKNVSGIVIEKFIKE